MRFAVVLYGGVSLAIYINGVVQELLRLVRASAPTNTYPENPWGQPVYFPTSAPQDGHRALRGSERVYRKLAQLLPLGDRTSAEIPEDADVRTRFVIDIVSGSSAGGINGIFLAKAIANQQEIDKLRDLWVDEGDIGILLNDKQSYAGLAAGIERQKPPRSLLNGQRLFSKALDALYAMKPTSEEPEDAKRPSYAEQLDLYVTTTDLQGLRIPIALHDRVVYESRHRHVFHFVYATAEATGSDRNDFEDVNDGMLAFAARATSSFPFAFEPVTLDDTKQVDPALEDSFEAWGSFFKEYASRGAEYRHYAFADGGYLDNKPFTHATAALRRRRSDVPVERKLVYVEPDPGGIPTGPDDPPLPADPPAPRPDLIGNVTAAAMTLPRSEPIRDDIQAVLDHNQTLEQLRGITLRVELDLIDDRDPFGAFREFPPDAPDQQLDGALGDCAVFHRAYRSLRGATVAEELASMIAAVADVREASDTFRAISLVIRMWIQSATSEGLNPFLHRFDLGYRLRRLKFVQDRINDLLQNEERTRRMLRLYESLYPETADADLRAQLQEEGVQQELLELKLELNDIFVELRRTGRAIRQGEGNQRDVERIRDAVNSLAKDVDALHAVLHAKARDREERLAVQRQNAVAYIDGHKSQLDTLEGTLGDFLASTFDEQHERTLQKLGGGGGPSPGTLDVRVLVRAYYERFDSFDAISLPLQHPDLGERNPVDIIRISPQDAISIIDETAPGGTRTKLAGNALGHFGGFLEQKWRRNDILWGRLDGADRILSSLLPDGALRDQLCLEAQAAILREELLEVDRDELTDLLAGALLRPDVPGGPFTNDAVERLRSGDTTSRTAMIAALRGLPDEVLLAHLSDTYQVPRALDPQEMLGVGGRAVDITGRVLEDTSKQRSVPGTPWFWASRVGRIAWGIAEVAMPRPTRTVPGLLFRYWTQVAILLAAILIVAGALGAEGAQKVGWLLLGIVLGIRVIVWLAEALMAPPAAPPLTAVPPPQQPEPTLALRAGSVARVVGIAALAAAGIGAALVVIGLFVGALVVPGWWIVAGGLLVALLASLTRVGLASRRRLLVLALAGAAIAVLGLAAAEVARHGDEDVSALASSLPGNRTSGFEESARELGASAWDRLWPWD